ncbi:MAG TPA: hypothetical protein VKA65_16360 [Acidimicrobiales bacterium]|nr:hypothetical protein [Acidimicrobiales bacterium]
MAKKVTAAQTKNDRLLQYLQRTGMRKGLMGTSRSWLYVFVGTLALRRVRRMVGSEPEIVFRGELQPGQAFTIDHLPETYDGRRVRVRRR